MLSFILAVGYLSRTVYEGRARSVSLALAVTIENSRVAEDKAWMS
jgi:hypothetical protein